MVTRKNNLWKWSFTLPLCGLLWLALADQKEERPPGVDIPDKVTFKVWAEACARLPANRGLMAVPAKGLLPLQDPNVLYRAVDAAVKEGTAVKPWIVKPGARAKVQPKFKPFAQRLSLQPGSKVIFHGDLHGDVHSLLAAIEEMNRRKILTGFKVTAPNTHLVFLGDYTDRGKYGIEVLFTLLRLKLENPTSVWLSRGNHEDLRMVSKYGFLDECHAKYGGRFDYKRVVKLFDVLPAVIYVGSSGNFVQSCHGGLEPGYDPQQLLKARGWIGYERLGELKRRTFQNSHASLFPDFIIPGIQRMMVDFVPEDPGTPQSIGFMWHDFTLYQLQPDLKFSSDGSSRIMFGQSLTQGILKASSSPNARVRGVIRAHQHGGGETPIMKRIIASRGVFRHWQEPKQGDDETLATRLETGKVRPVVDGGVYTFNVSPDSLYGKGGNYTFDTFGILTLAEKFEDWRMEVVNVEVKP